MRPVEPKDLDEINGWRLQRHLKPIPEDMIPKIGLIEPGLAAGFLISTDCSIAFLEYFITNRFAGIEERKGALEAIGEKLMEIAKEKGFRFISVYTQGKTMRQTCKRHGLTELGTTIMLGKEL